MGGTGLSQGFSHVPHSGIPPNPSVLSRLTVGGFNQPYVACTLIELPRNAEKGLSQRFLWMFPKPMYAHFDTLEPADDTFLER